MSRFASTQLPPLRLTPTSQAPEFLPTAVYLVEAGVASYFASIPASLSLPIGSKLLIFCKRLRVTDLSLCVNRQHPADQNATGLFYSLLCQEIL